jgi:hypothetical protein
MIKRFFRNYIEFLLLIFVVPVGAIALLIGIFFGLPYSLDLYPFGPQSTETIKIERLYIDVSGESSDYMIGTDKGVFEMDNSFILGIYNIDELYAKLEVGKTYEAKVKGKKLLNFLFQAYPHITEVVAH